MQLSENEIIEEARKLGVVDETKVRDRNIYAAFKSMRDNEMKYEDAIRKLALQFYVSEKRIENIITEQVKNNSVKN